MYSHKNRTHKHVGAERGMWLRDEPRWAPLRLQAAQIWLDVLLNFVVFFLLGDFPASEFYVPTFRNDLSHLHRPCEQQENLVRTAYEVGTECSEMSAHKIQRPGNRPKEIIQHSQQGESVKSRIIKVCRWLFLTYLLIFNTDIHMCWPYLAVVTSCL